MVIYSCNILYVNTVFKSDENIIFRMYITFYFSEANFVGEHISYSVKEIFQRFVLNVAYMLTVQIYFYIWV